jgi:hypothetical protein
VQENHGDDDPYNDYDIWEFTPFDVAVQNGSLHVSYPTALLGT